MTSKNPITSNDMDDDWGDHDASFFKCHFPFFGIREALQCLRKFSVQLFWTDFLWSSVLDPGSMIIKPSRADMEL